MPRHVGYGRPGTRVIPAGWTASHERVAAATHTSQVRIVGPAVATYNSATKRSHSQAPTPVYEGPAGITPIIINPVEQPVVEDLVAVGRYLVSVPLDTAGITPEHTVTVTVSAAAGLEGRRLSIGGVTHDPLGFEINLLCTLID